MGKFLKSQQTMAVVTIILSFAVGTLAGLWVAPPNGDAIDAHFLKPGKYWVEYPAASDFPVGPLTVATFKKNNTQGPWKMLLVLHVWDKGKLLVAVNENLVEWKNTAKPPLFEVSIENGKKKFTYWRPKAAELSDFYR